jgi:hypothetical protein
MSTSTPDDDINPGEIHDILRNDRRRHVIEQLRTQYSEVDLRELSERIAELESGESPPPRNLRQSVYNSLHQTHLPKLDERAVIDYDRDRKTVELLESARHVDVYMEVVTPYGITWATYYRTLAVLSLLTILAAELGVPALASIPVLGLATVFLVGFGISVTYQLWSKRHLYLRLFLD